jgi:hypothetical protein
MVFCGVMDIFNCGDDLSKMDVDSNKKEEQLDEKLYSRQLYVMGHEA